ncbi:MAG TPA: glycosyltransferase family 4 protein [Bacteroidales bacterium]|jgi:glycosyltransferase involved in cell wall biosynthesis|nr:MAG: Alpha-D-kanosaminyltransferase [Ignavibacteria bacterium ADurb.Bin266]HHV03351.1 glycosyltransferase family 4 protein [Bacteroidales bacterium]
MQTLKLSKVLQSLGFTVTVLCYFEHDAIIVKEFQTTGSDVKLLDMKRNLSTWTFINRLRKEIQKINPEVVHVQYMAPGALPIIAARRAGIKKIFATVHQPWIHSHGLLAKIILRVAALLTTKFIAVSLNAEKSWFGSATLFNEKRSLKFQPHHFTIHNAINIAEIDQILARTNLSQIKKYLNISAEKIIIGSISRLRKEKGVDILLDAFSQLVDQKKNIHLVIIGTGPDEDDLKAKAIEAGCQNQISFCGQAEWEHAMELLSIIDIVVVPSRFEGFGLAAAEAMALEKPVVASDTTGLKEVVIDQETGILFSVGNVSALVLALQELVIDPDLRYRYGLAGKKRVTQYFSSEIFTNKITALYND